ncbi:PucR family transcriptional regulator [Streptomyces sp. YS415]|uniref:PucR family transcriptional regulator n=1 Tax=Streptomyces sp. YS415 TaxID=2944806 RepID=UPI00202292F0|nr:PucR family transcriptional regulator [Streptomyces sp. YS415]MCL7429972.1 PucR family transcriptional regulator [Streptomyces sp. YS415]
MPDPSVPPTPAVPLSALLAREDLALRQIAGPTDPDVVIHWAHTSEMADPYPYLLGGELLLTAGVHIPEAAGSGTYFDDYVSRIVEAGGTALGFGLAPVHDTVPRALVAACESFGLPLLEVPPRTTFSGVARAVWQLMAQARLAELRRVTEAQQSLAAAASRPDPVPSVLRQLAQRVGGWAGLYGPEGTLIAAAGREPGAEARAALADLTGVVRPRTDATASTPDSTAAVDGRTAAGGGRAGAAPADREAPRERGQAAPAPASGAAAPAAPGIRAAGVAPRERGQAAPAPTAPARSTAAPASATDTVAGAHLAAYALAPSHGFVLGVAAPRRDPADHTIASVAAVLLSLLTGEQQSGTGAARTSALVRLLLGAAPEAVAPLLGTDPWLVVHARPDSPGAPDPVAASALGAALGSPLVDLAGDVVRVLVPADREPAPQPGWTLGVSDPATPAEWPAADTRAARALARARATRTPLVRHGARPGLADLVPHDEAASHARALLGPLAHTPALVDTLRAWLSLHGSWDRTAVALAVHRNTVRQRIARCAALLGTDLDDPDVRMELWFALRQ